MTYIQKTFVYAGFSLVFLFSLALFGKDQIQASTEFQTQTSSRNSQTIALLSPNFAVKIPEAIGGPVYIGNQDVLIANTKISSGEDSKNHIENTNGISLYIVRSGDTLSDIAELFNVSVNTIKWENNLSGNTLSVGKELEILPVTGVRHTIKKGDTFAKIAKKYDVETDDILIFNNLKPNELKIGEKVIVPNGVKSSPKVYARSSSKSSLSRALSKISSRNRNNSYYRRPTTAVTTSLFGPRRGRFHYGIDYGGPTGTAIIASASGVVTKVRLGCSNNGYIGNRCGGGYGNYMEVTHPNGTRTLYAHLSKVTVKLNQEVTQGQVIARMGNSGNSTGPHLHFEIIEPNGKKRNVNFLK